MPRYADIVLPLAQPAYTFALPEGVTVAGGEAVAVQFGRRRIYTGIVWRVHDRRPDFRTVKSVSRVLYGGMRLLSPEQMALWEWIASYYMCSLGEVMRVALPALMKPSGDTEEEFSGDEFRPRTECYVSLAAELRDEGRFHEICEKIERRAPKQYEALLELAAAGDETRIATGEVARRLLRADYAALGPYSLWALLFILVPLVFVAYYAFTDNNFQFTLENVQRFFTATSSVLQEDGSSAEVHTYLLIFWRSLKLAVISTVICLVLAYPLAYIMARAKPRTQKIFLTIIMIPMWMNFLIRTYAWMTILQDTGIFNNFLTLLHLPNVHIIGTEAAVVIGMVYDYIPYMILPLYSIMAKMDEKLIEAARDLGCNGLGVLRRVIWPLSLPGVISGVTMVLIPSVSTFVISRLLGGGKSLLLGDLIEMQFLGSAYNPHLGSAISLVMMVIVLVCMGIMNRFGEGEGEAVLL